MTNVVRRPTPADPAPHLANSADVPSSVMRTQPPELGPDAVAVVEGRSFMVSDAAGDVPVGTIGGLVHDDTRLLNQWELTLGGAPLLILSSGLVDDDSAAFFLTNSDLPQVPTNSVGVRRQRFVSDAMRERIELECFANEVPSVQLRLRVGTDFADLFEIKQRVRDRSASIVREHSADGSRLCFSYRNAEFTAITEILVSPPADRIEENDLVWDLRLEPGLRWEAELAVALPRRPTELASLHRRFGRGFDLVGEDPTHSWQADCPDQELDSDLLDRVLHKSKMDLVALRIEQRIGGETIVLPAAGLPWFLTVFGRDSLVTAYQSLSLGPRLARGALRSLANYQGSRVDDFRDEEPGKILHEVRSGELTRTGEKPHNPYYGTSDATQLWLILLSEYWRWTLDDDFVRRCRDNVHAALRWIDHYGDLDQDGYVEYATRSPQGLGNHCWRDSADGIAYSDGTIPVLPIATCEIQGYTYDAKLRVAELADGPLRDPELAERLRADAHQLRERFNRDFWLDGRGGYYAVGLDGDKRPIDSMTSNMGQLLWSGIVPPDRARVVAGQLLAPHMFSGWGIRTTSTTDRCYNPIGYHSGTVWPHDNSLIAYGLARYGFREEANRVILGMLAAADFSAHRLPEAFAGYDRSYGRKPVPYPTACTPQAWASAAPALFVRTLLGLEARNGEVRLDPHLPADLGRIRLSRLQAFGKCWDLEAIGNQGHVRLTTG
ncbi:glycogen debranching N-terminal domain-containing protein [Micromonospora sp. WMMD1102]|uniref:amylo-alpha-1,6-glucosidase n=1 Tax=Micromonospora sp. WMMD1102 TaxID=3016105 RepID=UPI002414F1C5|nr:glycogen debranching N-terminal domain-containing protein [Micromonospora sp. WMMD1102]MDG4787492.1 glycogen debranching N-terminal domain-containing protein [Micromonospora sp. WMMD1102]